jgi:hypothetical protein
MSSKFALEMVLVLLILAVVIQCEEVKAIGLPPDSRNILDPQGGDFGPGSNVQPVEDYVRNLTLHQYRGIRHKFPADYSGGSPDAGDQVPSDTTGITDSAASTIPEFPSTLILLVFMVVTTLGVMIFKTKRAI